MGEGGVGGGEEGGGEGFGANQVQDDKINT